MSARLSPLCARPQWCIAGADKSPYFINDQGRPMRASVTDPRTWMTFEAARAWGNRLDAFHIGYVLSDADEFACIDLDVKTAVNELDTAKHSTPDQLAVYRRIVEAFDSYTELSRSGVGLHVWVKAKIGSGARHDGVEVYSQQRFIICTGRPLEGYDKPIAERQDLLERLVGDIRARQGIPGQIGELVEVPQRLSDDAVMRQAWYAANSAKFQALWFGDWKTMGFPSQSEADLALMGMLTFYSESNDQCRRLFRMSGLGKREKATRDDRYVDHTLRRARATRASLLAAIAQSQAAMAPAIEAALAKQKGGAR